MRHVVAKEYTPKGSPIFDLLSLMWGTLVTWMQWLDLATLNEGLGAAVAFLTRGLLFYRIAIAHEEVTEETEADA